MTQAFKNFTMDESHNAYPGNWCTAAQAPGIFGLQRNVTGITIHYAEGCPTAQDAVNFFCNQKGNQTSAHYVAYKGYVACLVSPDDVAYACGDGAANCSTVSIECDPAAPDDVYPVVAELIMYLRGIYGNVPLYPHSHWVSTACPGPWDLNRLEALTQGTPNTGGNTDVALTPAQDARLTYIAGPQFKVDLWTVQTDPEHSARMAFVQDIVDKVVAGVEEKINPPKA